MNLTHDEINAALTLALVLIVVFLTVSLLRQRGLQRRYERLRRETGQVVADLTIALDDVNRRLIAAGYPPGRVVPNTSYPNWAPADGAAQEVTPR